jgi:hypothetical protein
MRKFPVIALLLTFCIASPHAAYLGLGQHGLEWGKKWNAYEAKLSASFSGIHIAGDQPAHFESREIIQPWVFGKIVSVGVIDVKAGVSGAFAPIQVHENSRTDWAYSLELIPVAYEVEAKLGPDLALTATEGFLRLLFRQNGVEYDHLEFGRLLPKFALRYYF